MNVVANVLESVDGGEVVLSAWCPSCRDWVMPKQDNVTCGWCGNATVRQPKGSDMAVAVAARGTATCKIDGCDDDAADRAGLYARLCSTHKNEAKTARANGTAPPRLSVTPRASADTVGKVRALIPAAKAVDQARAKLAKLPDTQAAKATFQEAARRAEANPTPENLARLQGAMKALKTGGAAKRQQFEEALSMAERDFAELVEAL